MYGRTEAESSGPSEGLQPLSEQAMDASKSEEKGDVAGDEFAGGRMLQRQASLAPWSAR